MHSSLIQLKEASSDGKFGRDLAFIRYSDSGLFRISLHKWFAIGQQLMIHRQSVIAGGQSMQQLAAVTGR